MSLSRWSRDTTLANKRNSHPRGRTRLNNDVAKLPNFSSYDRQGSHMAPNSPRIKDKLTHATFKDIFSTRIVENEHDSTVAQFSTVPRSATIYCECLNRTRVSQTLETPWSRLFQDVALRYAEYGANRCFGCLMLTLDRDWCGLLCRRWPIPLFRRPDVL